jgi:cytochrome P450
VAVSGWATHFDKGVYGADALEFRPERWLKGEGEDEDEYAERLRCMNKADLTWGHGDRACMGKNIARCEMYKLMATLYSMFDVSLRRDHRCPKDRSLTMLTGTTRES